MVSTCRINRLMISNDQEFRRHCILNMSERGSVICQVNSVSPLYVLEVAAGRNLGKAHCGMT